MQVELKEYNEISGNIQGIYHEAAVKLGISESEMDILYVLCCEGSGCNQSALYKKTGMTRSTVNSAIRNMEKDGILYLTAGKGRNTRVFLTDKGDNHIARYIGKLIDIENEIWSSWTESERRSFINLNLRYSKQLKEKIDNFEVKP